MEYGGHQIWQQITGPKESSPIRIMPNISLLAQTVSELQPFKVEKTGKSVFIFLDFKAPYKPPPMISTKVMTAKMCCQTTFEQRKLP